jgi:antitoxin CptB
LSVPGRLRWRCRRGTRELDRLLSGWLETRYESADEPLRAGFERLLDLQDPQLWDWFSGTSRPADPDFARIVDEIRAGDRV